MSGKRQQIGEWSEGRGGEWQNGPLFMQIEGGDLVLCDSSGDFNREYRLPLQAIAVMQVNALSDDTGEALGRVARDFGFGAEDVERMIKKVQQAKETKQ
jgi:hypothetical protein